MPSTVVLASRYGLPLDAPPEFVWGYADTMRMDSVRPSCMECVEKHLGAALVLMGEAEAGYPEHKLLAIGHLHEAAEESADMRPELSALLRDIRKRYQQGEAIEFEAILEALNQHGVWRFDQRGQGVACGNGWIPRTKKCSPDKAKQTSKEAKARTVEKAKARAELKRAVKAGKGQNARKKPRETYQISDAPYAKGKKQINIEKTDPSSTFKGDMSRLAENLGGRYSSRAKGYIMSPSKAKQFESLVKSANLEKHEQTPEESYYFRFRPGTEKPISYQDAQKKAPEDVADNQALHRSYVESALAEGKKVPDRVLEFYPDLKPKPNRTDSYLQGYLDVMQNRFDRKGEGVACGRGWISRRKKCGRDKARTTSPEAKARTVEKQKERQQLSRQVKAAKGQKPYVKPKGAAEEALQQVTGGGGSGGGGSGSSGSVVSEVITTIRDEPVSGLPEEMKKRMPNARSYSATYAFSIKGGNMDGTDAHVALIINGGEFGPKDAIIRTRKVAFTVNGETLTTDTKPEVGSIISKKISELFRASLLDYPDGTRVSTDAVTGDSRGDFRQAMYAKTGFSFAGGGASPGEGEQFAIVDNGRLVPAKDDFTRFSDAEQAQHSKAIRTALREAIRTAKAYTGVMNEDSRNDY